MQEKKQIDYKEYVRQMRENCAKDHNGNVVCSGELWEEIANTIENLAGYRKQSEGEWVETTEPLGAHDVPCVECSVCNESYVLDEDFDLDVVHTFWNYCPNCGAKMRGGVEK